MQSIKAHQLSLHKNLHLYNWFIVKIFIFRILNYLTIVEGINLQHVNQSSQISSKLGVIH